MWSAESTTWAPTPTVSCEPAGRSRDDTGEPVHVRAPSASSRRPVIVLARDGRGSPPARIRFFTARQSRAGDWAFRSAATPVTCGVAIDVPLNDWNVLPIVVLRMLTPGAPTCTVPRP